MAFSKSVVKAQNIIYCQLCEAEPKIKWKCVDCDLLMCDKCREKIHPKFKNAKDHKIVDIKEVGNQGESGKKDFTNIKCKLHQGQTCCIFCTTCDKLLCPSCIAKSHTGHAFLEIKESYEMKVEKLKKGQRRREKQMQNLVQGLQEQNKLQSIASAKCEAIMDNIHAHKVTLKKKIDEYANKLTKDVQQQLKTLTDSISSDQSKVEETKTNLQIKMQVTMDIIETTDVTRFFDEVEQLEKFPEEILPPVNLSHNTIPDFVPGDITETNLGLLKMDAGNDSKIELKVIQEYVSEMEAIHYISVGKDGSIWLGDSSSNKILMNIKPVGNKLQSISTYSTPVRGITVTPSNDLLFSDADTRLKQIISDTGNISDTKYSVDPLLIMSVHMTGNNKIILGAMTPTGGKPLWPVEGRRVIIVMNETGKKEAEYEYDRYNQRIISYPWDITSTTTGNICVVDGIASDRGRVVVLGQGGKVTCIYTGNQAVNTRDTCFLPKRISTTLLDSILVPDWDTHTLHILDSVGNFISCICTKELGIEYPYSLAWSPTGQLYIGCLTAIDSKEKSKVYLTDLKGC